MPIAPTLIPTKESAVCVDLACEYSRVALPNIGCFGVLTPVRWSPRLCLANDDGERCGSLCLSLLSMSILDGLLAVCSALREMEAIRSYGADETLWQTWTIFH